VQRHLHTGTIADTQLRTFVPLQAQEQAQAARLKVLASEAAFMVSQIEAVHCCIEQAEQQGDAAAAARQVCVLAPCSSTLRISL